MKNLKLALQVFALLSATSLFGMDLRFGPKVGLGIGYPIGLKEGDSKVAVGFPIGGLVQFDFGGFGIDAGLNYRYNIFALTEKDDFDGDGLTDELTYSLSYSSLEIPVTAYAILGRSDSGFFKLGGGVGFDMGFGKVKQDAEVDINGGPTVQDDESASFGDVGLKKTDIYLIAHVGYQWLFNSWALSVDLQPKYGLVDKIENASQGVGGTDSKWHTLWFDFTASFLF